MSCWHRVCCGDVCALWPNGQPSGKRPEAHQHLLVFMQRFPLWKLQWGLVRSARISQIQSLRNSRQDVINIQDKMDRSVFILKVRDRWIRFFICWKLQAGVFPCRANRSFKTKQADSQPACLGNGCKTGGGIFMPFQFIFHLAQQGKYDAHQPLKHLPVTHWYTFSLSFMLKWFLPDWFEHLAVNTAFGRCPGLSAPCTLFPSPACLSPSGWHCNLGILVRALIHSTNTREDAFFTYKQPKSR